jgi:hypothetical protein
MARVGAFKLSNGYARVLGPLYARTPKAVFAAIAVSALSGGGDRLDEAAEAVIREWETLHLNGVVPQAPPKSGTEVR